MLNLSLKQLSHQLREKAFSSEELTSFFLDRIKKHNDRLNAFITINEEEILSMAKKADIAIDNGNQIDYTSTLLKWISWNISLPKSRYLQKNANNTNLTGNSQWNSK